LWSKVVWLKY